MLIPLIIGFGLGAISFTEQGKKFTQSMQESVLNGLSQFNKKAVDNNVINVEKSSTSPVTNSMHTSTQNYTQMPTE
jgi:hypothetical protein